MIDSQRPLSLEERAAWPTDQAPPHFAESVVEAFQAQREGELKREGKLKREVELTRREGQLFESAMGATGVRDRDAVVGSRQSTGLSWLNSWSMAASLIAAVLLVWMWGPWRISSEGQVQLTSRQSIQLSNRAVVVGEAGTHLQWQIGPAGEGRVEQSQGRAFYRVEPQLRSGSGSGSGSEPTFRVLTPYGEIRVVGTCFSVEIHSMPKVDSKRKSVVLGAMLATAVTVTVYEGQVVLAGGETLDAGTLVLGPGERGRVDAHAPPRLLEAKDLPDGSAKKLVRQVRRQAKEIDQLRAAERSKAQEVNRLRQRLTELGEDPKAIVSEQRTEHAADDKDLSPEEKGLAHAKKCATDGRTDACSFVEPDEATLLEMARCGTVRSDSPNYLNENSFLLQLQPEDREELGMSDQERDDLLEAITKLRDSSLVDLRKIYVDAGGGSPEQASEMPANALDAVIENLFDRESIGQVQRRVAQERAGLAEAPGDPNRQDVVERWVRHRLERGNAFEAAVATVIGTERARTWRLKNNGWPGNTSVWSGNCEDLP